MTSQVLDDYSSGRVLTMSFEHGCYVSDKTAIEHDGMAPRAVARLLVSAFAEQIFGHGFVHCDPHPGNVLVRAMPTEEAFEQDVEERGWLRATAGRWWRRWASWASPGGAEVVRQPQLVLLDHGLYREVSLRHFAHFAHSA